MKDRIIIALPIEPELAHQARIAAATLNISRVELIRRATLDFVKQVKITANHDPLGGIHAAVTIEPVRGL